MLDSFVCFIKDYFFFSSSQGYPLADKTNRNGIAHGAYTDAEYGRPISFYKTIAAVDFLTFTGDEEPSPDAAILAVLVACCCHPTKTIHKTNPGKNDRATQQHKHKPTH